MSSHTSHSCCSSWEDKPQGSCAGFSLQSPPRCVTSESLASDFQTPKFGHCLLTPSQDSLETDLASLLDVRPLPAFESSLPHSWLGLSHCPMPSEVLQSHVWIYLLVWAWETLPKKSHGSFLFTCVLKCHLKTASPLWAHGTYHTMTQSIINLGLSHLIGG